MSNGAVRLKINGMTAPSDTNIIPSCFFNQVLPFHSLHNIPMYLFRTVQKFSIL